MAETTTVARPYAEAVFRLAAEHNQLDLWSERLAAMASIARQADVIACISSPRVTDAQLVDLFGTVESPPSNELVNLLELLACNGRLAILPEVHHMFEQRKAAHQGVADAKITTAFPLDASQLERLVSDLENRFKRKIRPVVDVDPALIGGVTVVLGDEVVDASVRGKLQAMSAALIR